MQQALAVGDTGAFEALMRRYNGRLFRAARAILKDDADAEDALQDAWLEAYRHTSDFRGDAQLSTWLTRIVVTQALMKLRKHNREARVAANHRATRRCAPRCGARSSGASTACH